MFIMELGLVTVCLLGGLALFGHKQWVAGQGDLLPGWQEDHPWRSGLGQVILLSAVIIYIRLVGIELSMLLAVVFCGFAYGVEKLFLAKWRTKAVPHWWEEVVDFFPLLLLVWAVRSFVIQPYRVPSDSLQPTVVPGDFLLVNQFSYGVRFPVTHWTLWSRPGPKRGDIAVFYPPYDRGTFYVKRVIGLPGDQVTYKNKTLIINGKEMAQTHVIDQKVSMPDILDLPIAMHRNKEQLMGVTHDIYLTRNDKPELDMGQTWQVPSDHYFMMGDNRDFSGDSRVWGAVPSHDLVGRASCIWLSLDPVAWQKRDWLNIIRWKRMFKWVG